MVITLLMRLDFRLETSFQIEFPHIMTILEAGPFFFFCPLTHHVSAGEVSDICWVFTKKQVKLKDLIHGPTGEIPHLYDPPRISTHPQQVISKASQG